MASLALAAVVAAAMVVFLLVGRGDVEFSGGASLVALVLWSSSTLAAVTALLAVARLPLHPRRLWRGSVLAAVSLGLLSAGALVTGAGARPVDEPPPKEEASEPGDPSEASESDSPGGPSPAATTSQGDRSEASPGEPDQVDLALLAAQVLPDLTSSAASILSIAGDAGEAATLLSQVGVEAAKQAAKSAVSETFTTLGDVSRGWLTERLLGEDDDSDDLEQRLRDAILADLEDDVIELVGQVGDEGRDELRSELNAYVDRLIAELKVELDAGRAFATREPGAVRIGGSDRYETAAQLAEDAYPSGSSVVYVATGARFPDALAAARASEVFGAPLLLVTRTALPCATRDAIGQLSPQSIVIVGGEQAVGVRVEEELDRALAGDSIRCDAPD